MFLLVDCNNFFASCELVANPALRNVPVVVLSNNGGIVVARSKEAKALGVPMGAAAFQYEYLFRKFDMHVTPANFSLYREISHQVMAVILDVFPEAEIASVDEAFIWDKERVTGEIAHQLKREIFQKAHICVSAGIGQTKTLAKAAVFFAKTREDGVFEINNSHLALVPIEEVWGIGSRLSEQMRKHGIFTAEGLASLPEYYLRSKFSVFVLRTAMELQGKVCFPLQQQESSRKSISTARSLRVPLYTLEELEPVLKVYVADVVDELQSERKTVQKMCVFLATSPFSNEEYYENSACFRFPESTADLAIVTDAALNLLRGIYERPLAYKKIGVTLFELVPESELQFDFWAK